MKKFMWASTEGFLRLELDSRGRNRGPNQKLLDQLDPNGIHMVAFKMPHNGEEWRCNWLVKLKGQAAPVEIWMDNSFEAFAKWTAKATSKAPRDVRL